ncbi:beta-ketoacyl-ACP synthase III [[Ruminococcus] torques]|uniref:beta-ketoacyl-ACP synthase III n=1 Tax=[Ruminococcus] torques TaxID=33039 RepID=UPI001FA06FC4|nr:beta-ketoacyl-ACP synthase III [[Ruminococcus] torques]MBS5399349.1 ketoacyl-ACP synthase III [Lachnospiraceae bacterium]MDM8236448.1 beta-ketoacyl-ACP synthase III [[Ruminococcus] torques]HJC81143.1 ketoacyl-ACP synthase III [Candidatus Mediterraneibacter excrementipullorum]
MVGKICGTGSYVPPHVMDNNDLAKIVDTSDEWIRERTGIGKRHIIEEETTSYMAGQAALRAVEQSGIDPSEIELILVATSSSEIVFPCAACEVQKTIGAVHAAGYDLNAACTGFVLAFNTAQAYIGAGIYKTVLVIGADSMSNLVDWSDRGTCILFGDGAGAVLLRAEEGAPVYMAAHSDGVKGPALTGMSRHRKDWKIENDSESYIHMDGQAVFKFAVRKVPEIIEEVLDRAGIGIDEIDYFVLHQANRRIIEAAAKRLKTDITKFPMNLEEYANTSAATVPILLDEMNREGSLHKGQKIMLAGFGAGLTWAACLFEWK